MLASDWSETKLQFPLIAQPKIDGVRSLNMYGALTGRSLKQHRNKYVTGLFSHSALLGLDGEMAAQDERHPDLCRITSSALSRAEGEPFILWHLFDYVTVDTKGWAYRDRLAALRERVHEIGKIAPQFSVHLRVIPSVNCDSLSELNHWEDVWLSGGYEGVIVRGPMKQHKQGRSTVSEGGLLRIKRFVDFEFQATEIIEGEENLNEAQVNELGLTFRSSHQENKLANGMIGAMLGRCIDDVKALDGTVLFAKGEVIKVGAGCLSHDQRKYYFSHQDEFKKLVCKGKFFPKGIKDKPRFPTWQSFRTSEDMS